MYSWIRIERQARKLSQAKLSQLTQIPQVKLSALELRKFEVSDEEKSALITALANFDALNPAQKLALTKEKTKWRKEYRSERVGTAARSSISKDVVTRFAQAARHERTGSQRFGSTSKSPPVKALALFSGCGGMALGFQESAFDVIGHVEIVDQARCVFEHNFVRSKCLGKDIKAISNAEVVSFAKANGPIDIVFGGPPCQGFSLTGKRDIYDPRNQAYREFARIVDLLSPRAFVLENVRLLTSMRTPDGGLLLDDLLATFSSIGYKVQYQPLNAMDYGVPQFRERVFFIGTRDTERDGAARIMQFPELSHGPRQSVSNLFCSNKKPFVTLRECIGDLEHLESGEKSTNDPLHFAVAHPSHVIAMLKGVPEGCSAHENLDPSLRPKSGYNTTYKRLRWDEVASTISTTFGMISGSRNVHPSATRSLTIREALRCQSFPDDFVIFGKLGEIRTMIGNAVPPKLAAAVAQAIMKSLRSAPQSQSDSVKVASL